MIFKQHTLYKEAFQPLRFFFPRAESVAMLKECADFAQTLWLNMETNESVCKKKERQPDLSEEICSWMVFETPPPQHFMWPEALLDDVLEHIGPLWAWEDFRGLHKQARLSEMWRLLAKVESVFISEKLWKKETPNSHVKCYPCNLTVLAFSAET